MSGSSAQRTALANDCNNRNERPTRADLIAMQAGVFGRRGAWFDLPDGTEHNGQDAVLKYLRGNPEAIAAIREKPRSTSFAARRSTCNVRCSFRSC